MRRPFIVLVALTLIAGSIGAATDERPTPPAFDLAAPAANRLAAEEYERAKTAWYERELARRIATLERGEAYKMPGPVCELKAQTWQKRIGGVRVGLPEFLDRFGVSQPITKSAASCATINVTYTGFTAQAQTAFQFAVDIWARLLDSPVTINVNATFMPLAPGILGSAGPNFIRRNFAGGVASTWYADALADKLLGAQLGGSPGEADINANFSSTFTWYFGTDGEAPVGTYDFVTVVLHELGHGLGFFGFGDGSAAVGTLRNMGDPGIYDRFVENGSGTPILTFVDPSVALGNQLRGGDLFHDSPASTAANGGTRPEIFAPSVWNPGSSYSHWDEATFPEGNIHSLMTPNLGFREAIHQPGPITLGAFDDHGWTPFCPTVTPVNDLCIDALPAPTCGDVTGTTTGASREGEPADCETPTTAPGVWYEFTGTGGSMTVSTCNQATYDTKIGVFTGGCGTLSCVAGNDDGAGCSAFTSEVTFNSTVGTTYLAYVHGFQGATGDFTLTIDGDTDNDGLCDPVDPDDDNDGVNDGPDPMPFNPDICGDSDTDTCDDCTLGTDNFGPLSDQLPNNDGPDTDSDGQCNAGDPDDDNDGVNDDPDPEPFNPDICGDSDTDTCDDCTVGTDDFGPLSDQLPNNDGTDTDSDGLCNAGDPDDDNDGVNDDPDPEPLNPNVCGLDDDGDTCDDCSVGVDWFGPLPDNDIANDGPDDDGDGICNDGDELYLSVLLHQFVGATQVIRQNVYHVPPGPLPIVDFSGGFLPSDVNLDALDVEPGGDILFSVDRNAFVGHAGGVIILQQNNVYRLSGGVITLELNWAALGLAVGTLNAIDRLADGSFVFSTVGTHFVVHAGGFAIVRPWQIWRVNPGAGTLLLVLDPGALYGVTDVDGVDQIKDGRIAFSSSRDTFFPPIDHEDVVLHDPAGAPLIGRPVTIHVAVGADIVKTYDGSDAGLTTIDGLTVVVPE